MMPLSRKEFWLLSGIFKRPGREIEWSAAQAAGQRVSSALQSLVRGGGDAPRAGAVMRTRSGWIGDMF